MKNCTAFKRFRYEALREKKFILKKLLNWGLSEIF